MKSFARKTLLGLASMSVVSLAAVACSPTDSSSTTESDTVLSFVVVTSTEWDGTVTLGSHTYTFAMDLEKDNTVNFNATCTGEAQQGGGGMGGFPFAHIDTIKAEGEGSETSNAESSSEDFSEFDFSSKGTWTLEEGYGYIINIDNKVIHTDYNRTQGRHQFFTTVSNSEGSATVLMQARDSEFRNSLAADYEIWDVRNSDYIFTGHVTGNNNSVAEAYIYCHKGGEAVFNTVSGNWRSSTLGLSWTLENGTFTLIDGQNRYVANNSINTEHPGYRLSYSSAAFFCSTSASVTWDQMENGDFDGKTLYQFTGTYTASGPGGGNYEMELNLSELDSKCFLYQNNVLQKEGTYTFENEIFTISFPGEEDAVVTKGDDGLYTYTYVIISRMPWGAETRTEVSLTYNPGA